MGLSSPSEGDHTKQEQNPFKRKADRATLWLRPRSVPEQARSLCGVMNPLCDSEEDVHMHGLFQLVLRNFVQTRGRRMARLTTEACGVFGSHTSPELVSGSWLMH